MPDKHNSYFQQKGSYYSWIKKKNAKIGSVLALRGILKNEIKVDNEKKRLTWEVPAAARRAASHPATLVDRYRPAMSFITLQSVRRQVAHLQLCEVPLEIIKRHPEGGNESRIL